METKSTAIHSVVFSIAGNLGVPDLNGSGPNLKWNYATVRDAERALAAVLLQIRTALQQEAGRLDVPVGTTITSEVDANHRLRALALNVELDTAHGQIRVTPATIAELKQIQRHTSDEVLRLMSVYNQRAQGGEMDTSIVVGGDGHLQGGAIESSNPVAVECVKNIIFGDAKRRHARPEFVAETSTGNAVTIPAAPPHNLIREAKPQKSGEKQAEVLCVHEIRREVELRVIGERRCTCALLPPEFRDAALRAQLDHQRVFVVFHEDVFSIAGKEQVMRREVFAFRVQKNKDLNSYQKPVNEKRMHIHDPSPAACEWID